MAPAALRHENLCIIPARLSWQILPPFVPAVTIDLPVDSIRQRAMSSASNLPLIQRALKQGDRLAIIDRAGQYSYTDLLTTADRITGCLLSGQPDLGEARVAFMVPPSLEYAAVQWGI